MGIGLNFVCNSCNYDTGLLMLAQGAKQPIQEVVDKFIHTYSNEIDLQMLPHRAELYKVIVMYLASLPEENTTYFYQACVCYGCNHTYEMLDIFIQKEEEVYARDRKGFQVLDHVHELFCLPEKKWQSLIGKDPFCLFCDHPVIKITDEELQHGVQCPKCKSGKLHSGQDFIIWD